MIRTILICCATAILAGCATVEHIAISDQALSNLNGSTLATVPREKPSFGAMTAGKALFGAIGAVAMLSAGNEIVEENAIADPAGYIGRRLAEEYSVFHNVRLIDNEGAPVSISDASELAQHHQNADYLLDVQTINWGFGYFPTDWNSYRVTYSARLRLIDTNSAAIVAQGFCSRVPEKTNAAPSREDLLEDGAFRLKEELRIAADYCIDEFKTATLRM